MREYVIGLEDKPPTPEQLAQMRELVRREMEAGALGVTTALIYPPAFFAKTDELIELCKVAAKYKGKYTVHMRSEGDAEPAAIDEAVKIGREAHIPVEIWHLKISGRANWGRMKEVVGRIEAARAAGLDVTADMYPWIASANGLDASIPDWAHEGGVDAMVARIRDPAQRAKMIREIEPELHAEDILLLSAVNPEVKKLVGKRLDAAARDLGKTPAEALVDLVAMDRANVGVARFGMSEEDVRLGLSQPWVAMDTDYGAMAIDGPFAAEGSAHPRAFASTARILGHYARDERLFTMEEAVRKMTSLPARRLGLQDRGLIRVGMKADLIAFDPATVRDTATFEKPMAYPEGIPYVVVNGKIVLDNGKRTKERPGRPLRHLP